MANAHESRSTGESLLPANPLVIFQGISDLGRDFLAEVGSMFWFVAQTFDETIDRIDRVSIEDARRVNQLTDQEVLQIREAIDRDYTVEGDLRRETAVNIKRLMDLACYRGLRHRKGLPVRGQRTHTNARTRKGKARPIAGKKK